MNRDVMPLDPSDETEMIRIPPKFRLPHGFRSPLLDLSLEEIKRLVDEIMAPAHFFVRPTLRLEWVRGITEEVPWEIFQGRLLEARFTRLVCRFVAWNVYQVESGGRSTEPLLSVKYDAQAQRFH